MALDFPAPAVEGQGYSNDGASYVYHNGRWMQIGSTGGGGGGGGDGLDAVVDDPDPHLGGDLILNGHIIPGLVPGIDIMPYSTVLANTEASFTLADETKLDALPTNATLVATYAPIASPTFTGDPKAPTPSPGDNDTSVATTAFVTAAIAAAPGGLDTEGVQDIVGGMVSGNTETGITVTYDDGTGKLNFVVSGGGGVGDVVGPASAVDNAPVLFNLTTGKLIKETTYPAFKTSLALTKGDVGLGNVDNTADTAKPVSTAQQTALNLKANLAGPTDFTGAITVPNQTAGDNDTSAANTAFVSGAVSTLSGTVNTALALKANLAGPTFTGTVLVPNVTAGTNNQQAANTAFVQGEVATAVGGQINAATAKTALVDADTMPLSDSAASFALKKITWANLKASLLAWLGTSAAGAQEQVGIITSLGLTAGQTLGPVAPGGAAFTVGSAAPMSYAKLSEYMVGTNANLVAGADVLRYMSTVRAKTYAATVTITLSGLRVADGDATTSDGPLDTIAATGNLVINFGAVIHAGFALQSGQILVTNSGGGARTVAVSTANGITVVAAPGVTITLSSTAGAQTLISYIVLSTTKVMVTSAIAVP